MLTENRSKVRYIDLKIQSNKGTNNILCKLLSSQGSHIVYFGEGGGSSHVCVLVVYPTHIGKDMGFLLKCSIANDVLIQNQMWGDQAK